MNPAAQQPPQAAPEHVITALQTEVASLRRIREALEGDNLYLRSMAEHYHAEAQTAQTRALELESQLLSAQEALKDREG